MNQETGKNGQEYTDRISVIVAVYNSAVYLPRCLDSVIGQTYHDLEIILVNDGSTDESGDICDRYAADDARIKVIHQDNMGLAASRNTGLDAMTSPYVLFVDGDDQLHPEMVERLYGLLRAHNADIAQCDYLEVYEKDATGIQVITVDRETEAPPVITVYDGRKVVDQLFVHGIAGVVQWNKLFRREIFASVRFPAGVHHEDEYVVIHELFACKRLVHTSERLYFYFRRANSITSLPTPEKHYSACLGFLERLECLDRAGYRVNAAKTYSKLCFFIRYSLNVGTPEEKKIWTPKILQLEQEIHRKYRKYAWAPLYVLTRKYFRDIKRTLR